jgi:hypothetical protein
MARVRRDRRIPPVTGVGMHRRERNFNFPVRKIPSRRATTPDPAERNMSRSN